MQTERPAPDDAVQGVTPCGSGSDCGYGETLTDGAAPGLGPGEVVPSAMTGTSCPHCGRRRRTDREVVETRTVGVTNDWETWRRVACDRCGREFIYRVA